MGQDQSAEQGRGSNNASAEEVKICYYELLGVPPQSSDDEIKKAYRKKALELHPDRNYDNVENTTKRFAEVQAAYEVLSDPQERAWYDSHRDAILRNVDLKGEVHYEHNVRVTTAEDIMSMFMSFEGKPDFANSPTGFYSSLHDVFATLAREETLAYEWEGLDGVEYPSFGSSGDNYDATVKAFYATWSAFATRKSFSWKDVFRYNEAPDRRTRRMMEKENKRLRDEGIRDFNEAVRALVAFVKKRDPRIVPNKQSDAERQKSLRDKASAQAARSRAANEAKLKQATLSEWAKISIPTEIMDVNLDHDVEVEPEEQFECVVCQKIFKSEKQWEAHEKSKKHAKAVQHLRRKMQKEDEALRLDTTNKHSEMVMDAIGEVGVDKPEQLSPTSGSPREDGGPSDMPKHEAFSPEQNGRNASSEDITSSEPDDEYAPREELEERMSGPTATAATSLREHPISFTNPDEIAQALDSTTLKDSGDVKKTPKLGKAKEKRAKKAAQKAMTTSDGQLEWKCASCHAGFPSKTRLFTHIKDFGHAASVPKAAAKRGRK
ncbi:hypothetical protein MMC13_005819 [Lambiella insularis]|nr:hypothetical protein [Lambiella insularis]